MPVKRRNAKRRVSPEREYEIWSTIFGAGFDFFHELPELGIAAKRVGKIDPELAREPWARMGQRWLAEHEHEGRVRPVWAVEQFGHPWEG